ncbi:MAG: 16S rRNA (guanine(527)-N(7))-methyltransferase RsmG [Chloroflexota bacterium]|nr:16S rRNA (guanine(527)-N(7))-methyltransferase RsmG [Chloroflexota bacterium]
MPAPDGDTSRLADQLANLPVAFTDETIRSLARYRDLLLAANQHVNLTAVRDAEGVERRLIVESLRLVPAVDRWVPTVPTASLIDIGTGAGIPGLVLAIARPSLAVTLLDATGKKVAFLRDTIAALGLANVTAVHGRAETVAHEIPHRAAYDLATARGVASLPALCELCLPFLRPGGVALLVKGTEIDAELVGARAAAALLGGEVLEAPILPQWGTETATRLAVIRKSGPTPRIYPRRSGVPVKSPLGGSTQQREERAGRQRQNDDEGPPGTDRSGRESPVLPKGKAPRRVLGV